MTSSRGRWMLAALLIVAAGCGGDDDSGDVGSDPGASPTSVPGSEPEPTDTPATTQAAVTTSTTVAAVDAALPVADSEPIVQTTETSGGGTRPLLSWEAVDGAVSYIVVVYAESGEPYWSAVTEDSEVFVGGSVQIPEDNGGPRVADGYSWIVYASNADDALIASSPQRPISP